MNTEFIPLSNRRYPSVLSIDGKPVEVPRGALLNHDCLEVGFAPSAGIRIYCFNSLMLPIASKRTSSIKFRFTGPHLGLFHATLDSHEGPYLNHHVESLSIEIAFPSTSEAEILVNGSGDLARSNLGADHTRPREGTWSFALKIKYCFPTF